MAFACTGARALPMAAVLALAVLAPGDARGQDNSGERLTREQMVQAQGRDRLLAVNTVRQGRWTAGSPVVYRMALGAGETVRIDAVAPGKDSFLALYDAAGIQLDTNDDGGIDSNARLLVQVPAGKPQSYFVLVREYNEAEGAFDLILRRQPPPPAALPLATGQDIAGEITDEAPMQAPGGNQYVPYVLGVPRAGQRYRLTLKAAAPDGTDPLDPMLQIRRGGSLLAENDDANGRDSALIFRPDAPGAYQIVATTPTGGTGAFVLRADLLPEPAATPERARVAIGQAVPGRLTPASAVASGLGQETTTGGTARSLMIGRCRIPAADRPHMLFEIPGSAGDRVTVRVVARPSGACRLLVEAGADTPAGFAVLRRRTEGDLDLDFQRAGDLLVRVSAGMGEDVDFDVSVQRRPAGETTR